jgi:hypothetical protein
MIFVNFIGLFIFIAGFVIGLGAVTVIDIHGFLGRKSKYWTEATTRTHKVTKPLIWLGIFLAVIGGIIFFRNEQFVGVPMYLLLIAIVLILNGLFLSFRVSPYLLQKEKEGRASELLSESWQRKIIIGLVLSDFGWWSSLALVIWYIVSK